MTDPAPPPPKPARAAPPRPTHPRRPSAVATPRHYGSAPVARHTLHHHKAD